MSAKNTSPTAQILRHSRFFSLPRPLGIPALDTIAHGHTEIRAPNATLPYPIRQAIITIPKGLGRGDWGLKRSLPLSQTLRTTTPIFRLNAMDTREHITDYSPASDLTLNLYKIQELGLAITTPGKVGIKSGSGSRFSPFEELSDSTDPTEDAPGRGRWKYKGPWVAGMTQGDFELYISKELAKRKDEFASRLWSHASEKVKMKKRSSDRHEGLAATMSSSTEDLEADSEDSVREPVEYVPSDEEIQDYIRRMRTTFTLGSELATVIEKFLDLPSNQGSRVSNYNNALEYQKNRSLYEQGPPRTHPSAGISYLRSNAWLDNHPIFGPQRDRLPVQARILKNLGSQRLQRTIGTGKVGVAGVVIDEPISGRKERVAKPANNDEDPLEVDDREAVGIGLGTPGGNKLWVLPTSMQVDSRGRVVLKVDNAEKVTIGLKTGEFANAAVSSAPMRSALPLLTSRPDEYTTVSSSYGNYGSSRGKYRYGLGAMQEISKKPQGIIDDGSRR